MNIDEAKIALDEGHMVELSLPARPLYLAANYHLWRDEHERYTLDVHYAGEQYRRDPILAAEDWAMFLTRLALPLLQSLEWKVIQEEKQNNDRRTEKEEIKAVPGDEATESGQG